MTVGTGIDGLQGISQIAAARLIDSLVQGTALALTAALFLVFFPRSGSRLRFGIWFSVLVLMIAAPFWPLLWSGAPSALSHIHPVLTLPASWSLYVFAFWGVVAGAGVGRVVAGILRIRKLRLTCVPVDDNALPAQVQQTLRRFRTHRNFVVCTSEAIAAPAALGFLHPAIVIPTALMDELSTEDLNHVLLHELAHIRRRDDWSNLAQKLVGALLFFHPLVWWIEHHISLEREIACDEAVIAATANPRAYAQCLAFLAERSYMRRSLQLVQAAVGRMRQTTMRVAKILAGGGTTRPQWNVAVLAMALLLASGALIARMPDVIAFKNSGRLAVPAQVARVAAFRPMLAAAPASEPVATPHTAAPRARVAVARRIPRTSVTLASNRRMNRRAIGDVVLVVFEDAQPGNTAWQVRVWQVTLIQQTNNAQEAPRKVI